jgi:hypothetical protein
MIFIWSVYFLALLGLETLGFTGTTGYQSVLDHSVPGGSFKNTVAQTINPDGSGTSTVSELSGASHRCSLVQMDGSVAVHQRFCRLVPCNGGPSYWISLLVTFF